MWFKACQVKHLSNGGYALVIEIHVTKGTVFDRGEKIPFHFGVKDATAVQ